MLQMHLTLAGMRVYWQVSQMLLFTYAPSERLELVL